MDKNRMPCIRCGVRRVIKRKHYGSKPPAGDLRKIRFAGIWLLLASVCLAGSSMLCGNPSSGDMHVLLSIGSAAAGFLSVLLGVLWGYWKLQPPEIVKMYHYRCLACGSTWDEPAPAGDAVRSAGRLMKAEPLAQEAGARIKSRGSDAEGLPVAGREFGRSSYDPPRQGLQRNQGLQMSASGNAQHMSWGQSGNTEQHE